MAFQADYGKGMELNKPADPFQQRLQQSAPSGPPPVNPASFRSNPFAKMGGMGARAAMAQGAPQGQPPPQAPAYGMRSRQQGGMRPQFSSPEEEIRVTGFGYDREGRYQFPGRQQSAYGDRRAAEMEGRNALRMRQPMDYRRGAEEAYGGASLTPPPQIPGLDSRRAPRELSGVTMQEQRDYDLANPGKRYGRPFTAPPPTGMPGGIMGERNPMDRTREFAQGGGFDPLRARLMAQRGGGMPPPPQSQGNPFFDRMRQAPPVMGRPGPPIMQEDYPMSEPVYY